MGAVGRFRPHMSTGHRPANQRNYTDEPTILNLVEPAAPRHAVSWRVTVFARGPPASPRPDAISTEESGPRTGVHTTTSVAGTPTVWMEHRPAQRSDAREAARAESLGGTDHDDDSAATLGDGRYRAAGDRTVIPCVVQSVPSGESPRTRGSCEESQNAVEDGEITENSGPPRPCGRPHPSR